MGVNAPQPQNEVGALFLFMATIAAFPTADLSGPPTSKFFEPPRDYDRVTTSHEFEDGGKSFNADADEAPRTFELTYDSITPLEAQILDEHYDAAFGQVNDFPFTHPLTGEALTGVHYVSYERSHSKRWIQSRRAVLAKYPDFD